MPIHHLTATPKSVSFLEQWRILSQAPCAGCEVRSEARFPSPGETVSGLPPSTSEDPMGGVPNRFGRCRLGAVCRLRDRCSPLLTAAVRTGERNYSRLFVSPPRCMIGDLGPVMQDR